MGNCRSEAKMRNTPVKTNLILDRIRRTQRHYLKESVHDESWAKDDSTQESSNETQQQDPDDKPDIHRLAATIDCSDFEYPFQNLVFEGGGNKGIAYCGAVKRLEELGLLKNIKRFAGASAGAMTATLLAVGYSPTEIQNFLSEDLSRIFLDHKCGYCSLLPNLLTGYGWNPGRKIYQWFGKKLARKCNGNDDITFLELYRRFGKELCIVVTNLNQMTPEYFHPKTTPSVPVRMAVRMTMSIPGMFRATEYAHHGTYRDIFVDGGVLCNYPIHCFDGWWLSLNPDDRFLKKIKSLRNLHCLLRDSQRFEEYNDKTLGFLLYADHEPEVLRSNLEMTRHFSLNDLPNTKLVRKHRTPDDDVQKTADKERCHLSVAVEAFLNSLDKIKKETDPYIERQEMESVLNNEIEFPTRYKRLLFGDVDNNSILSCLDKDQNGQISYQEILSFMEETGLDMHYRALGYQRQEVKSFFTFLNALQSTLLVNVKRIFVSDRDFKRTVGINTGHVGTSDFVLEEDDREFLVERGRRACDAFLRYYAAEKKLQSQDCSTSKPDQNVAPDTAAVQNISEETPLLPDQGVTVGSKSRLKNGTAKTMMRSGDFGSVDDVPFMDDNKYDADVQLLAVRSKDEGEANLDLAEVEVHEWIGKEDETSSFLKPEKK